MLELESPKWKSLSDAYGQNDIPEFLKRLARDPEAETSELWSRLCHQGDVISSSVAAFPHVVLIASQTGGSARTSLLTFAGRVAAGTPDDWEGVDEAVRFGFERSLPSARKLVVDLLNGPPLEPYCVHHLLGAVANLHGCSFIGQRLDAFLEEGFAGYCHCPHCDEEHFVDEQLRISPDNVWEDESPRWAAVKPDEPDPISSPPQWDGTFKNENARDWLIHFALRQKATELAKRINAFYGITLCPKCNEPFRVLDRLEEEGLY